MKNYFQLLPLMFGLWLELIRFAVVKCLAQGLFFSAFFLFLLSPVLSWRGAQLITKSVNQKKPSPFVYTMQ